MNMITFSGEGGAGGASWHRQPAAEGAVSAAKMKTLDSTYTAESGTHKSDDIHGVHVSPS